MNFNFNVICEIEAPKKRHLQNFETACPLEGYTENIILRFKYMTFLISAFCLSKV